MTLRLVAWAFDAFAAVAVSIFLPAYITGTEPVPSAIVNKLGVTRSGVTGVCIGALLYALIKWAFWRWLASTGKEKKSMYGLQHGRLHLQASTPMWMNMGYWDVNIRKTMAEACRDLLKIVLAEAGFSSEAERAEDTKGSRRPRLLIDLGFGCGDQTIYLMSETPVRPSDRDWWDEQGNYVHFDHYVGITMDPVQARYAQEHVEEMKTSGKLNGHSEQEKEKPSLSLFCADAAKPTSWSAQIRESIEPISADGLERWVLALDTAYHFSPSRWPLIKHAHKHLHASFIAFDLCLSPTATSTQKLTLRILTTLMGAPWANFGTPDDYRRKLVETGYSNDDIKIVDVSERVFTPLAHYLEEQDSRLKSLGLSIGSFSVAKSLFGWWGRSGVVRGVVVVARR